MVSGQCPKCGKQHIDPYCDDPELTVRCQRCGVEFTVNLPTELDNMQPKRVQEFIPPMAISTKVIIVNEDHPLYGKECEIIDRTHAHYKVQCGDRVLWIFHDQVLSL